MKRFLKSRLFALTLVSIIIAVFLSSTVAGSQNPEWITYDMNNSGLPGNFIEALAIDSQGNIWVGLTPVVGATTSPGGLAKFDGNNWTVYNENNSDLPSNCVKALIADSKENLWIGTNHGLAKFDGSCWTVYTKDNSDLPSNYVSALTVDTEENIWIGTFDKGVVKFDGVNWTVYNERNSGLPNGEVFTLITDSQGNLWYGTISPGVGLVKFDGVNWTDNKDYPCLLLLNYVRALATDSQENLWIGTIIPGGLIKFDGVNCILYGEGNSGLPNDNILALAIDSQDNIWTGTEDGLVKFDNSCWTLYDKYNSSLLSNSAQTLAIDKKENIWIGTRDGLAVYREGGVILNNPVVVVEERYNKEPSVFTLLQNYPNPFNPSTEISFYLSTNSQVTLTVFNTLGQKIATLVDETKVAGSYQVRWNGTEFPTGIYFYRLKTEGFSKTMKMLLMK